jgi:hypothetical protein
MNPFATGRLPHSPNQLAALREKHAYRGLAAVVETVTQPVARLRNQRSTPSCVGQACAGAIHALTGFDGSAINLWTDARRRQGDLDRADYGTTAEAAIESLIQRGLDPYEDGEESRPDEDYTQQPDLMDELEADDNRISPVAERFIVTGTTARQRLAIVDALKAGRAVLWATGVEDPFFGVAFDTILDSSYIGADYNGHEMRIAAYDATSDLFLVQNSWGEGWCGCSWLGERREGCCLVRAVDAIEGAWDLMVLELRGEP